MMDNDDYGMITEIIEEETIYLRHYIGEVVAIEDELKRGRIKITLPELGMDTPDKGLWCNPRQSAGMIIPNIGSWAEVYFINGDRQRPVYLFPASEILDNTVKNYKGNTKESILFEDSNSKENNIKYNSSDKTITVFDGEDFAVKYEKLKEVVEELQNDLTTLKAVFSGWVVVPNDGGSVLKLSSAVWSGTSIVKTMSSTKVEKVKLP